MSTATFNLDKLAAEKAQEMVRLAAEMSEVKKPIETLERLVTKTLGILQSQGVYAMMLFLFSRSSDEEKVAKHCIQPQLYQALKVLPPFQNSASVLSDGTNLQAVLKFYSGKVLEDLDTLLLVRDLYEQTLIYARYHAKALGGDE